MNNQSIDLKMLEIGTPGITPEFGACLAQAAAVCLEDQRHSYGVVMNVDGDYETSFSLIWSQATEQMKKCWGDIEVTTEHGAYGVAILLLLNLTEYTIIERSKKGTGFDYWLGYNNHNDLLFQGKARLEVSGIRNGDDEKLRNRTRKKIKQIGFEKNIIPGFVIIVEFSSPRSRIIKND
jgi:hypothetical protein